MTPINQPESMFDEVKQVQTLEEIVPILEEIEHDALETGFDHKDSLFIKLATEEACINAWEYCKSKNYSTFSVAWKKRIGTFLEVIVSHKGEKFEINQDECVNKGARGRGLQLILAIMDIVKVDKCLHNVYMYMRKDLREGGSRG